MVPMELLREPIRLALEVGQEAEWRVADSESLGPMIEAQKVRQMVLRVLEGQLKEQEDGGPEAGLWNCCCRSGWLGKSGWDSNGETVLVTWSSRSALINVGSTRNFDGRNTVVTLDVRRRRHEVLNIHGNVCLIESKRFRGIVGIVCKERRRHGKRHYLRPWEIGW